MRFRLLLAFLFAALPLPALAQAVSIVAFGGSSTYGQGVRRDETFPVKLEAALRARGIVATVTNAGVSGRTSTQGVSQADGAITPGTNIAIIELGVNDSYAGIDTVTTQANVNAIAQRARSVGARVLIIGYRGGGNTLAGVAKANGAEYMPGFSFPGADDPRYRVAGDPQADTRGYGHFNSAGYDKIVAMMMPHVMKLIGKPR